MKLLVKRKPLGGAASWLLAKAARRKVFDERYSTQPPGILVQGEWGRVSSPPARKRCNAERCESVARWGECFEASFLCAKAACAVAIYTHVLVLRSVNMANLIQVLQKSGYLYNRKISQLKKLQSHTKKRRNMPAFFLAHTRC